MSPIVAAVLVAANLGLIFLLLAAPLGVRTVRMSRRIKARPERVWGALWPLGEDAGWSGDRATGAMADAGASLVRMRLGWEGRDGAPIERTVGLEDVVPGERFALTITDDSALDQAFWRDYRETAEIAPEGEGAVQVTLTRTDRYRGLAFYAFRYFALRREIGKLKIWAETGRYRPGGAFEHPLTQVGLAVLSALVLWPFFGLHKGGLALAVILTAVVALHELGHMAAFRMMGHRRVRMIFVPLLGGIAIGGRPYDSRFEVAFVALMGAGFSAFVVPLAMAGSTYAAGERWWLAAALLATFAGLSAFFNLANLVPVWKFDGGQVLRQICPNPAVLGLASFVLFSLFLGLGYQAGFSARFVVIGGIVFAVLSLLTAGNGVKPRHDLKPIAMGERLAVGAALAATFAIHGYGLLWAAAKIT